MRSLALLLPLRLPLFVAPRLFAPLAFFVVTGMLLVSPYLAWLGAHARLASSGAKGFSSIAAEMPFYVRRPFTVDLSHGVVSVLPPAYDVVVRWRADVDGRTRAGLERRYGFELVAEKSDGRSVVYSLRGATPDLIQRVVQDPRVEDTEGIDRSSGDRLTPTAWERWTAPLSPTRLTVPE